MKKFINKNIISIILLFVGAMAGLIYWKYIGCESGSCAIKSNPYMMTLYGAIIGYLLGSVVDGFVQKRESKSNQDNRAV